jgi:hypothetical protein
MIKLEVKKTLKVQSHLFDYFEKRKLKKRVIPRDGNGLDFQSFLARLDLKGKGFEFY